MQTVSRAIFSLMRWFMTAPGYPAVFVAIQSEASGRRNGQPFIVHIAKNPERGPEATPDSQVFKYSFGVAMLYFPTNLMIDHVF